MCLCADVKDAVVNIVLAIQGLQSIYKIWLFLVVIKKISSKL